jgi:hypothetical protein
MFAIRLYIAALTLAFLLTSVITSGIGVLHATILTCSVLYLILDLKEDLQDLKQLESQVELLSR